tara:strand:- start:147 stop:320 length:174 start_codon:yes stop_codon:yes gene_type:complete
MKYSVAVWDIQFYKVDEDGNELLNDDGSVKMFTESRDIDLSWVADSIYEDDVKEVEL